MASDVATPPLFRAQGTPAVPGHPALLGGRCRHCGGLFFPMQQHGCEFCGATDLEEQALGGRGTLISLARVNLHASADRPTPFTVGAILLDEGVVVRALLDAQVAEALRPGDSVVTQLIEDTRAGRGPHDLRFGKEQ